MDVGIVSIHQILCVSCCTDIETMKNPDGYCYINFEGNSRFLWDALTYMLECSEAAFQLNVKKYQWLLQMIEDTAVNARESNRFYFAKKLAKLHADILAFQKKLPVFGFNSGSFDMPVLRAEGWFKLLSIAEKCHPRALKRGNSYVMVDSGSRLVFLDALSYLSGKISLRRYLKEMGVPAEQGKLYFWYEAFTPENAQKQLMKKKPPKYEEFYSNLRNCNVLDEDHHEWNRLLALGYSKEAARDALELDNDPIPGPEKYKLFLREYKRLRIKYWYQYLARYTNRDTSATLLGIRQFKRNFIEENMNPFYYASLSALAFPLLVRHLAQSTYAVNFFVGLNAEAFKLIKSSQIGGLTHNFDRLCICGFSKVRPHEFGTSAETVKRILSYDVNALYAGTIGKYCTKVAGFYAIRHKKDDFRLMTVMEKPHIAHAWILFLEQIVLQRRIQSALSFGGEKKLVFDDGTSTYLDGWFVEETAPQTTGNKHVSFGKAKNFHGCFWHAHEKCYPNEIANDTPHPRIKNMTFGEVNAKTKRMDAMIRNHSQVLDYEVIYECEFLEQIRTNPLLQYWVKNRCHYGPPVVQTSMTEGEAIKFILQKKIVGFARVQIETPEEEIQKFLQLPPLCVRETVSLYNLKGTQKKIAKRRGLLENGQTTIMSKFAADDIVLGTDLLIWYIENGLKVRNLTSIIQFSENLAFEDWIDNITRGRLEADRTNSSVKEKIWKLIGNGSYGYSSLNLSKRFDVHFGDLKKLKFWLSRSNFYQSFEAGIRERPTDYFEMLCRKRKIQEQLPLQFGCEVLSTSKAIVFDAIHGFFTKFYDPQKWCLLGMDTDGWQLATSETTLEAMVIPELRDQYETEKDKWLIPEFSPDRYILKRQPHLLELELVATLASVHLAPKSCIIVDQSAITKSGHKGFSQLLNPELVTLHQFVQALFSDGSPSQLKTAKLKGLRQDPSTGRMATFDATRAVLSNLAMKFNYCSKAIHHIPRDLPKHLVKQFYPFRHCDVMSERESWDAILRLAEDTNVQDSVHLK